MTEYSLHQEIKKACSISGDKFEVKLGKYIVDILRENLIIEVQTKNFSALKEKLQILTSNHQVRLVYPLVERKWITYVTKNNIVIDRRKSPRKGVLTDVFRELVMIPHLMGRENFSLEVLFIDEEEIRCADGKGSWRRRGVSIKERKLLSVNKRVVFQDKSDYLKVLPEELKEFFTNRELSKVAKIPIRTAQQITYCLRKSGIIQTPQKRGKAYLYQKS
ncbi:MAG: hypothetical protein WC203_03295 [Candidatus Bathyarchaeia archaeon]